ncbi:hypothetical protein H0G86_004771 [Trichoderma simmonsii]|uniref:Uncharacterized protein n=1 Tax=Trichoderma simmonsii TaxID=1491479 RepID=A0A8G0LAA1_9HYPO|nr:hypothetical protein H0G86_004771 [Trichoderma simmonsii]
MSLQYFPPVKPSAIALGTFFNHGVDLVVLAPVFGQTYQRAKAANTKEEFIRSREASGAAVAWGTSFVGSALQSYGVGALLNATGTLSHKGAAYLGALIFAATSAPGVCFFFFTFTSLICFFETDSLCVCSSSLRSLAKRGLLTLSASMSLLSCSRLLVCPWFSTGGEPGPIPLSKRDISW